jgi:hypothetical protein
MPLVSWEAVWDVLKWVLLVLAAGFIGQFGKALAIRLIERKRRRQAEPTSQPAPPSDAGIERARLAAEAKIEKKRAKTEIKREKKRGEETP